MTIMFPDDMRAELERGARETGLPSVDEYVLTMYTRAKHLDGAGDDGPDLDLLADPKVRAKLVALAEEGLKSPAIELTDEFWDDLVRRAEARIPSGGPSE